MLVVLGRVVDPATRLRHPQVGRHSARTVAPSPRSGCRRTPARTLRSRSRPSLGRDLQGERSARRLPGGGPTPPCGSARRRRTPRRSPRGPGPAPPPAPAAAPATSPGPASPPSTPARRTRIANHPAPAPRADVARFLRPCHQAIRTGSRGSAPLPLPHCCHGGHLPNEPHRAHLESGITGSLNFLRITSGNTMALWLRPQCAGADRTSRPP